MGAFSEETQGVFTDEMLQNLGDYMCNCDEVGGDEKGKGKSGVYVYKGVGRNAAWRSTDLGGDHNPFHVTVMLTSFAKGTCMHVQCHVML